MLGDTVYDDANYTGETGDSVLSVQYYRNKAREFQTTLNNIDSVARAAQDAVNANISPELTNDLSAMLAELEDRKRVFRLTAETINAGAAVFNALGGRFPQLSVPTGLAALPVIPLATIAALGVAAGLITWGSQWVSGVNERLELETLIGGGADPIKLAEIKAAVAKSNGSWTGDIANIVKWSAIGAMVYFAFNALKGNHGNG